MRGLIAFSLPLLAAAAATHKTETDAAPLLSSINSEVLPDNYIIVFKKHVTESSAAAHHGWVQDIHLTRENERAELRKRSQFPITTDIFKGIKHTYNIAGNFLGYSGHFDDEVIEQVRSHPDVSYSFFSQFLSKYPVYPVFPAKPGATTLVTVDTLVLLVRPKSAVKCYIYCPDTTT